MILKKLKAMIFEVNPKTFYLLELQLSNTILTHRNINQSIQSKSYTQTHSYATDSSDFASNLNLKTWQRKL